MKSLLIGVAIGCASMSVHGEEVEHLFGGALWTEKSEEVVGAYTIERDEDQLTLRLSDDFETKKAPDLKIVLSPHEVKDAKNKNALEGGLVLGLLESHEGAQSFSIPTGTDFDEYKTVLIHCEQYTKLWAATPLQQGELLAHGSSWTKKSNKISGSYEIVRDENRTALRLSDDFKTSKAPDLKLVLSPHTLREAKNGNALAGGRVVSLLRSHKGAQEYVLEDDVDLASFESLLIHCEQYTKLWGGAPLR